MIKSVRFVNKDKPASLWKRVFAYIIDILMINLVVGFPFRNYLYKFNHNLSFLFGKVDTGLFFVGIFFVVMMLAYFVAFEYLLHQTFGKMVMRIYVVSSTGKELRFSQIFVRNFLKPFQIVLLVDVLYMIFKGGHQRLFELFSRTIVVEKEIGIK